MESTDSLLQSLAITQVKILGLLDQQRQTRLDGASMQKLDKVLEETAGLATVFQELSGLSENVEKQHVQNRKDYESLLKKLEELDQSKRTTLSDEIKNVARDTAAKLEKLGRVADTLAANGEKQNRELWWQHFNWIGIGVFWLLGFCWMGWGCYLRHQYGNAEEMVKNADALQTRITSQLGAAGPKEADYVIGFLKAYPVAWKAYQKAHPWPTEGGAK